ncbi:MAG: DMT family transporter [Pseudoruegeria sp.]
MPILHDNTRGALHMIGAMAGYTVNDAFIKVLLADMSFYQAIFIRGCLITLLLCVLVYVKGGQSLRMGRKDWVVITARTITEVTGTYFFLVALSNMPIANVTAILQSLPLTVALAAALFLREPIGWGRMIAILIGFVGVLLIVQPGTEGFDVYAIYGLIAVAFITARDVLARIVSDAVPSMSVAISASIGVTLFGGVGMVGAEWVGLSTSNWLFMGGSVIALTLGYIFSVSVMRIGDVGFVAPFRYSSLLIALVLGFVLFREWPDTLTLIGSGIVVATGIWVLFQERTVPGGAR